VNSYLTHRKVGGSTLSSERKSGTPPATNARRESNTNIAGLALSAPRRRSSVPFLSSGCAARLDALEIPGAIFALRVQHGVPQKPICFGLITAAAGFKPRDHVRIEAHRDGFLCGPVELADFGAAPIGNRGSVGEINVSISFCGDGADVSLLLLCKLLHKLSFHGTRQREPK